MNHQLHIGNTLMDPQTLPHAFETRYMRSCLFWCTKPCTTEYSSPMKWSELVTESSLNSTLVIIDIARNLVVKTDNCQS